ncbi:kinase-like domain-containing protein [Glomus cerebriforme]|uniref:Kinase-like domain-containing protein n=1 Tax=Glomus cerebriforme TaxID=658196 RepID=A0A397SXW9_9GLOM|nr:kinase-like domain-containing protein [Glomus cerebriforme]
MEERRICENCKQECIATTYCEYCVRNYLKAKFSDWTSENNVIDNLIQKCQTETLVPKMVVEWIPYNNLQNIKYLTKVGGLNVILKKLKNVENADQSWLEEVYYMLVMRKMDIDLRNYLQQNHNQLIWKERILIMCDIINAIDRIHREKAIHRDLHSGNILYSQFNGRWFVSDLGFCGPADKSPKSIYGNLPYVAPEEISSGQPPFNNYNHDYYLATNIINGTRPKIVPETSLEYKNLMEQCWNADPLKRSDIGTNFQKI